jgi:hypothetical protein
MQRHTTHYAAYDRYWEQVTPAIVDWFSRYVAHGKVVITSAAEREQTVQYLGGE